MNLFLQYKKLRQINKDRGKKCHTVAASVRKRRGAYSTFFSFLQNKKKLKGKEIKEWGKNDIQLLPQ